MIVAAVFLLAAAVPAWAVSKPKCSYCGKSITGKYMKYKVEGRTLNICKLCRRTSPKCGRCSLPIRKPKGWDGRKELFCPTCFKKRVVCVVCRKTIKGEYLKSTNTGEIYCRKCDVSAVKCASCNKPLRKDERTTIHGKRICDYCNERSPKCDRCGLPIVGPRVSYRFADGVFCTYCDENRPHCYVCAVPLGDKRLELSDDRLLCPNCSKSAILSTAALRMIHHKAVGFLRRKLDMDVQHDYELKLARRRSQLGIAGREIHGKEQGLFSADGDEYLILVLEGATEEMCYETIAHEYAHAWHAENGMRRVDRETREGFAQWAASKTLEHFGLNRALKRLQSRTDPDYGTGYRKFAAIEKKTGVKGVFEFLRQRSRGG